MSTRRFEKPLILRPQASRRLAVFLLLVHGAAALSVLWSPFHWGLHAGAGGLIVCSLIYHWRALILRRGRWSIIAARWSPDGGWHLSFASGATCAARLSESSVVLPWLLILSYRCQGVGTVHLLLPPDALGVELARELRVRLRTVFRSTEATRGSRVDWRG